MDKTQRRDTATVVNWLLRKVDPRPERAVVTRGVEDIVRSIADQKRDEQATSGEVNEQLAQVTRAVKNLERLLYDDEPRTRGARKALAAALGEVELDEFSRCLESLGAGRWAKDMEFAPKLQSAEEAYRRRTASAARELHEVLSENSPYARALRRHLSKSAIATFERRLQGLSAATKDAPLSSQKKRSPLFAVADVAKSGAKTSSGGRPPQTAKLAAVWGAHTLLIKLKLAVTDDKDGVLCRLSDLTYEVATGEEDADLSLGVKNYLKDLHARRVAV